MPSQFSCSNDPDAGFLPSRRPHLPPLYVLVLFLSWLQLSSHLGPSTLFSSPLHSHQIPLPSGNLQSDLCFHHPSSLLDLFFLVRFSRFPILSILFSWSKRWAHPCLRFIPCLRLLLSFVNWFVIPLVFLFSRNPWEMVMLSSLNLCWMLSSSFLNLICSIKLV